MRLYEKYTKSDYTSYEDYCENFSLDVPKNFNFAYDVIDELSGKTPDKTGLIYTDLQGNVEEFSFSELSRLSNKAANYLRSLGIKKGDRVLLLLKRRWEYWITVLALHKLCAVVIPATYTLTKKDIEYRAKISKSRAIIAVDSDGVPEIIDTCELPGVRNKITLSAIAGWENLNKGMAEADENFTRVENSSDELMLIFFTSGTTGMPKMVAHNFAYPLGHITTAVFWQDCAEGGLHLAVSDSGWAKCAWGKIYGQWLAETCVFVYDFEKFVPLELLSIMEKFKVTTFCAPPTIFRYFIKEDLSAFDLSAIKHACTAGEPLNAEVFEQFKAATGLSIMEGFGQSETVVALGNFKWMKPKSGSLGKPNPLYDLVLLSDDGNPVIAGENGEICIRIGADYPTGLFTEYLDDSVSNSLSFRDGIYHTGDIAWRDEQGYHYYVGRADDVIKTSGYRVGPFEVESALMEHPAVLETAIIGIPHPDRGQVIKAFVVLARGYEPSEQLAKALQSHVKKTTAPYKYPRSLEFVEELPKTVSGKIKRAEIRQKEREK